MRGFSQTSGSFATHNGDDLRAGGESQTVSGGNSKSIWYVSRDEIKTNSPSRKDGIDSVKENELRKSYCSFLKELGIRLRMPNFVIATSTVFCHRFYLHQSHNKNDRFTIATACMFLAGKVEEARRGLEEVVFVSYYLQNKNNPTVTQEMKDRVVCERQKELVLTAEQVVLVTLDFNLKIRHPYNYISEVLKRKPVPETLIPVAFVIVNDTLFTTLCLQFEPQPIAASTLFLAAKLVKYKFPYSNWWKQFNVTLCQLEEISVQILEFYEQERLPHLTVQSSSSSSSVDKRARGIADSLAILPGLGSAQRRDNGSAMLSKSPTVSAKKGSHTGFDGSMSRMSEESRTLQRPEPNVLDSEAVTKRRRLDEGSLLPETDSMRHTGRTKTVSMSKKGK